MAPRRAVPGDEVVLFPALRVRVGNPLVHTNVHVVDDPVFARWLQEENRSRDIELEAVVLKHYPPGALLMGHDTHWVLTSGVLVAEQVNPIALPPEHGFGPLLEQLAVETIEGPCLLASRYGASTWGHWALEILPRIVVAEHAEPGRFRFVVPDRIVSPAGTDRRYVEAVLGSLAAYGVDENRLVRVRPHLNLRFASLHDVGGVWSASAMNRDVCRLMRDAVRGIPAAASTAGRLAVLRRNATLRTLRNAAEIEALVSARGFAALEMEHLAFVDQVALFREARHVVAALGSGLAGLVHAPEEVRIVTIGPAGWYDRYFTNVIQERCGLLSDVRGPRIWDGTGLKEAAPIDVHAAHVSDGLDRLAATGGTTDRVVGEETIVTLVGDVAMELSFEAGGDGVSCLRDGWAAPERDHVWTLAGTSRLELPRIGDGDIVLEMEGAGVVVEPFLTLRPLTLLVNGVVIGRTTFGRELHWLLAVPALVLGTAPSFSVELRCPISASPRALGIGDDDRPLGLALTRLRIRHREG